VRCPLEGERCCAGACGGLAGLGSLLVLGVHDQIAFGHADAFYLMDSSPGLRAPGFPGENFLRLVFSRNTFEQKPIGRGSAVALAAQGVVALVLPVRRPVVATGRRLRRWNPTLVYPALVGLASSAGSWWTRPPEARGTGAWRSRPPVWCVSADSPLPVLVVTWSWWESSPRSWATPTSAASSSEPVVRTGPGGLVTRRADSAKHIGQGGRR